MKQKNWIWICTFLAMPLTILTLLGSCKKDVDTFTIIKELVSPAKTDTIWHNEQDISDTDVVRTIAKNVAIPPQLDSVDITKGDTVVTTDNVTIIIPSLCANTQSGTTAKGKAQLEFLMIKKKGYMIRSDKPTVTSNGSLLESGGEIFMRLTQGGQELELAPGKTIRLRTKDATADTRMRFFYGNQANINQFNWLGGGDNNSSQVVKIWVDSSRNSTVPAGYDVVTSKLHWINCDKLNADTAHLTKVCVQISADSFTNANTMVFLAFRDVNAVVKLWGDPSLKKFCTPSAYKGLPIGKVMTVVTISKINNVWYLGALPNLTISANLTVPITPSASTDVLIAAFLNTL